MESNNAIQAIDAFLAGQTGRFGKYISFADRLVFRDFRPDSVPLNDAERIKAVIRAVKAGHLILTRQTLAELESGNVRHNVAVERLKEDVLALRIPQANGHALIGNSARLELTERGVVSVAQLELQKRIPMLPLNVFKEAGIDVKKLRIIAQNAPETVKEAKLEYVFNKKTKEREEKTILIDRHFTGASLFEIETVQYLFDLDRRELEHGIINPFLVRLPARVSSIADAYESLIPIAVKNAQRNGLKVLRQGEWFFVPADELTQKRLAKETNKETLHRITLSVGRNRPNYATGAQLSKGKLITPKELQTLDFQSRAETSATFETFLTGKVSHAGREHADLELNGWFVAVPNTAQESFTITGDVD